MMLLHAHCRRSDFLKPVCCLHRIAYRSSITIINKAVHGTGNKGCIVACDYNRISSFLVFCCLFSPIFLKTPQSLSVETYTVVRKRKKKKRKFKFRPACELINFDRMIPEHIQDAELRTIGYRIVAEGRSITPEVDVNFLAPIARMDKLACIGLNYSGHCQETGKPTPESPIIFSKFPSNIIGPHDNIVLPQISDVSRRRRRGRRRKNRVDYRSTGCPL